MARRQRTLARSSIRPRGPDSRSRALSDIVNTTQRPGWDFDEETTALLEAAFDGAEEKVALDSVVLKMGELMDAFDALFICAGHLDRQVRAIAEEIERRVALATQLKPLRSEGWEFGEWVALDYGFVIVHVFDETTREYYDLEHLWNAAPSFRRSGTVSAQ